MPTLTIVSGSPQTQPAYAASGSNKYVTEYAPLVVRLVGRTTENDRVRFWCAQANCALRVVDEETDDGKRDADDKTKYDEVIKNGTSTLHVRLANDQPAGSYEVYAQTVDGDETGPKSPPFKLISR